MIILEFEKIVEILKREGYKKQIVYNEFEIKEIPSYHEDCYRFLVKEGNDWRFGYISMERGKNDDETIGVYSSLKEGSNSFILNRLRSYYMFNHVSKAENDTQINKLLIAEKLALDDLLNALSQCNVPMSYLSTQKVINHSIRVLAENDGWISEYIDMDGISHKRTKTLSLPECIAITFARIMYLYLLDNVAIKYLDGVKAYKYFTPDEIAAYVG